MSFLKQYILEIKTLSPVFIGCGKKLTKKDYLLKGNKVHFIDFNKFYDLLARENIIEKYEDFAKDTTENDLYYWFTKKQHIEENKILPITDYTVNSEIDKPTGFSTFIKDNYNKPYVPGSSVKGAIRTALLAEKVKNYNGRDYTDTYLKEIDYKKGNTKNVLSYFDNQANTIETKCLNTSTNINNHNVDNSVMRGIQISDSLPLKNENLVICSKIDYSTEGNHSIFDGKNNTINTAYECLKHGTVFKHILTLDTQLLSNSGIDREFILDAINYFYKIQKDYYISKFDMKNIIDNSVNDNIVFLGGNSGFVSKTLLYPLLKDNAVEVTAKIMQGLFKEGNHKNDKELGVSPHMLNCTKYGGKLCLMGECEVKIDDYTSKNTNKQK